MRDLYDALARDYDGDYENYAMGFADAIEYLENAPALDVQEVRHGEWDEIRDAYGHLEGWIHRGCGRMSMGKDKYCPKCGAKMDLEN